MKRIVLFIGTRPEAIKMAPVIKCVDESPDMEAIVVSTGQHRELLEQVIDLFGIEVQHNLAVMQPNQTLESLTASLITTMGNLLGRVRPAMAIAQGDTTTAFVGALAAFYQKIPFGHVEAGLRTGNLAAPFPEEANRRLISVLTSLHFPPTETGRANLQREGVPAERVVVTGNTVIDALLMEVKRQGDSSTIRSTERSVCRDIGPDWAVRPFVLITGHRRENFGAGFDEICRAIAELATQFPTHRFIYPVHPNPNVRKPVYQQLGKVPNVCLLEPMDYRTFVLLLRHCRLVLTDSGGVQEEAPTLGKPVLVMRETTERPEGVHAGTVRLVGAVARRIVPAVCELLSDADAYRQMSEAINPYGDGHAAPRIVNAIRRFYVEGEKFPQADDFGPTRFVTAAPARTPRMRAPDAVAAEVPNE